MEELMGMGFDAEASRQAWQMYGNLEHAVNHLLTNPHPTSTQVAPSVAAPSAAGALQLTEAGSTAAPTTTEPDAITDSAASPAVPEPEVSVASPSISVSFCRQNQSHSFTRQPRCTCSF
eukprot:m.17028 g.17028  ORF g.17028 m.17028 type:complete len:119 (+) comp7296_c0_seq1:39-395(+)